MSDTVPTASEIVLLNAFRFVDVDRRGVAIPGTDLRASATALARTLVQAALVANVTTHRLVLERDTISAFLGMVRWHEVRVRSGGATTPWSERSLEQAIMTAAPPPTRTSGISLTRLLREALRPRGDWRPDPIRIVELSVVAGGWVQAGADSRAMLEARPEIGSDAADEVQRMLADFRQENPELWLDVRRTIDRVLRLSSLPLVTKPRRRFPRVREPSEPDEYDLSDWERLNRNPPSAPRHGKP